MDLDEFLSENGVSMDGSTLGGLGSGSSHGGGLPKRERSPSPSDCMSPDTLNPPSPCDSSEDNGRLLPWPSSSAILNFSFLVESTCHRYDTFPFRLSSLEIQIGAIV